MTLMNKEKGERWWKGAASDVSGTVKSLLLSKFWQIINYYIFIPGITKFAVAWGGT